MNNPPNPYHVVELSPERRGMAAFQELKAEKHNMYALLEVDVTVARKFIDDYRLKTGEQLSFTGYLLSCLARAVDEDKTVQSYRKGSKQLVLFDDVDVGFMIELKKGDKRLTTGTVIRAANRKTCWEIHQEIRSVQARQEVPGSDSVSQFRSAMLLPRPLFFLFKAIFRTLSNHNPTMITSMAGTVGISSVGMFGKDHAGWGISGGSHVLDLVVGGIVRQPAVIEGQIAQRDILDLTVIFDHDVIDGAPAARFTRRLIELVESGYGLQEIPLVLRDDQVKAGVLT